MSFRHQPVDRSSQTGGAVISHSAGGRRPPSPDGARRSEREDARRAPGAQVPAPEAAEPGATEQSPTATR
jgi:hypothetical protein